MDKSVDIARLLRYTFNSKYYVVIGSPASNLAGKIGKPVQNRRSRATVTGEQLILSIQY